MMTIFKKEMRLFFAKARSYVLLGIMMLLSATFFTVFNLIYANVSLAYTLVYTAYASIIVPPVFALWMFTREDRAAGELFLFSLPISVSKICLGKFFALFSQCSLAFSPLLILPLILEPLGDFSIIEGYCQIFLFGVILALLCAVSLLVFSVLRNKVGAFVLALFCSLLCIVAGAICDIIPATALCALVGTLILFALIALVTFLISRRLVAGALIFAVGIAISLIGFFVFPKSFGSAFSRTLALICPLERLNAAYFGLFDLWGAVFTLCFTAILVFAAALVWSSRQRMEDSTVPFVSSKPHKIFAATIVAAILLSTAFSVLPASIRRIRTDGDGMYKISNQSERFLRELGKDAEDVDIYFLTSDGKTDYQVYEFLERYVALNSHIDLHTVNVTDDASEVSEYLNVGVSEHSVLVKSSKRARLIDYGEMFYFYNWDSENSIGLGKIYPSQYESYYAQYSQYFENIPTVFCFDGDNLLTNAINFVTSDNVSVIYTLLGHSESDLSATANAYLEANNCDIKYISVSVVSAIPDECDMLLINAPKSDLSEDEIIKISSYLDRGGSLMVNQTYNLKLPNLDALLASYGVSRNEGLVCEGDDSRYLNQGQNVYPNYIIGTPLDHQITEGLTADSYMMFLDAADIKISAELPNGVKVEPFFVTSEISFRQLSESEDDVSDKGVCNLGVAIEAQKNDGKTAKIVYFSSGNVLEDIATSLTSGGNLIYGKSAISYLTDKNEPTLSVNARLVSGTLTISRTTLLVWSVLLVLIVPSAVIITGLVNKHKRKNK